MISKDFLTTFFFKKEINITKITMIKTVFLSNSNFNHQTTELLVSNLFMSSEWLHFLQLPDLLLDYFQSSSYSTPSQFLNQTNTTTNNCSKFRVLAVTAYLTWSARKQKSLSTKEPSIIPGSLSLAKSMLLINLAISQPISDKWASQMSTFIEASKDTNTIYMR